MSNRQFVIGQYEDNGQVFVHEVDHKSETPLEDVAEMLCRDGQGENAIIMCAVKGIDFRFVFPADDNMTAAYAADLYGGL